MAAKKKAKKPLARKAMKKAKGGAAYIKFDGIEAESPLRQSVAGGGTVSYTGLE